LEEIAMTSTEGIHVRRKAKFWVVERGNYLLGEFANREQALQLGRSRAKSSHSVLVIHAEDGAVASRETFKETARRKAG
jgi:hypothetical protein